MYSTAVYVIFSYIIPVEPTEEYECFFYARDVKKRIGLFFEKIQIPYPISFLK